MHMSEKILIIAPAWVGDMIMIQPLLQLLKQADKNCTIDILAPRSTAHLAERMEEVNKVHLIPIGHGALGLAARWQLGRHLRPFKYTWAIVLPNTLKSALIPWVARIPRRTGWKGEQRYGLLNDMRHLDTAKYPRLVERYAALAFEKTALLPPLPYPKLQIDTANQNQCLARLSLNKMKPILALCPGAEYGTAKRWPADYFASLATHFIEKNWQVWIIGSAKENTLAEIIQIKTEGRCIDLTGKTSLIDAIDLLAMARVAVSNDSGLMHISCAVNTPIVALYGSSSSFYTPPLNTNISILRTGVECSPCFKRECPLSEPYFLRCLRDIHPEQVIKAVEKLI